MTSDNRVSLTSQWFIRPGNEESIIAAIRDELVPAIEATEPGTLTYLVHRPFTSDAALQSLPPTDPHTLVFFEEYESPAGFRAHVTGRNFTDFVSRHGDAFVQVDGRPYTTVTFLNREAGFVRAAAPLDSAQVRTRGVNRHPAVMFEVLSPDAERATAFYREVFGWSFDTGSAGFSYVHFPVGSPPLLGGIGRADAGTPGMQPGTNFYLLVDHLAATLERAVAAGGTTLMPPSTVDGYHFAMFTDPDGFAIGLVEPFPS